MFLALRVSRLPASLLALQNVRLFVLLTAFVD